MEKLMEVLSIQTTSYEQWRMFAYIIRQVVGKPTIDYYVEKGNIYITKGKADSYPCMVAHMDTVHEIVEDLTPIEIDGCITGFNRVTMEQTGIGGDDKVGVYIALQCLEEFDNIKLAFFRDEEVGCDGSYDADMHFFKDCRFVLQCDRRGNDDFITNASGVELSSNAFQDDVLPIIKGFGYKFAYGAMTDVMALKENGIKCSVANISCGYYNPHTAQEYVNVYDVEVCLDMCKTVIRYCTGNYTHKVKKKKLHSYKPSRHYDWYSAKDNNVIDWDKKDDTGKAFGWQEEYCKDCWGDVAVKNGMCKTCNDWYTRETNSDIITF